MEDTQSEVLIAKVQSAHAAGLKAIENWERKWLRRPFLVRASGALRTVFGYKAPIVQKYSLAIRNLQTITKDEYTALLHEFHHILNWLELISGQHTANPLSWASQPPSGNSVFIIHGHDEVNTLRLNNLLQNHFGVNPILMRRTPGMSRALLTKFEDIASRCSFAFALMTPDDEILNGMSRYLQARPNVIFEVGWFVGRLGIPRVCLLLKEGTTVHSDIDGISRIHFHENVEEKVLEIQKELDASGLLRK